LGEFANAVYAYAEDIYRVWLIAPWLSLGKDASEDPVVLMVDALRGKKQCVTSVITRPPTDDWHRRCLGALGTLKPVGYFCNVLHSKLYAFESPGFALAMFGSPNLTSRANEVNVELAIELRGPANPRGDDVSRVIADLLKYAGDLVTEDSVRLWDL
jgi:hypothetical protein